MPSNRYYSPSLFTPKETITLDKEESHHLLKVMRTKIGEEIELVNGKGQLAKATLEGVGKEGAEIRINTISSSSKEPEIIIAQAYVRPSSLEWIVEKGTELGASSFWLFPSENSEKDDLTPNQKKRLETILISALKQCGRLTLPTIALMPPLSSWEKPSGTLFFGDTRENAPFFHQFFKEKLDEPIFFFVGPEKGFSSKEEQILEDKLGAKGVKLHRNILRAETAPLAALSLLSTLDLEANQE